MAKVFRLHKTGRDTLRGWDVSSKMNQPMIDDISDPAGATARREITSVPSPFARMDLIKKAFTQVNSLGHVGTTIHHKMVSHALDVAEVFYNIDKFTKSGLFDLVRWDVSQLSQLTASPSKQHQLLGRTLDLFMRADTQHFNFDKMQGLYMLRYIGPGAPTTMEVVGSTSPASLFYTSANDFSFLQGRVVFGTHQAFADDDFQPLEQRADQNFILWLYALRKAMPGFAENFTEVNEYLNGAFEKLSFELQKAIHTLNDNSFSTNYAATELTPGVPVEIMGLQLTKAQPADFKTSKFAIKPSKKAAKLPLVLPHGRFAQPWLYTTSNWDPATPVPLYPGPINERQLPADGTNYPYLTMTDFLEDTLIATDSKFNDTDFFNGNLVNDTGLDLSMLLPVKPAYFQYFTTDDLRRDLKMTASLDPSGTPVVKVNLSIPVQGGVIPFERTYTLDDTRRNEEQGRLVSRNFSLAYFPRTRFNQNTQADYVVSLLSKGDWHPTFDCLDGEAHAIQPVLGPVDRNLDAADHRIDSTAPSVPMISVDSNFDLIGVSSPEGRGIAVPNFAGIAGGARFDFAVDFGTSNTHIEYRKQGDTQSHPLDITSQARQMATFNEDAIADTEYSIALRSNLIPSLLGPDAQVHFPLRTILTYKEATNWQTPTAPYLTGNLPFFYGTVARPIYNAEKSNLKWSNDSEIEAMLNVYLGGLLQIMRNKVVMEGGDLSQMHLRWFYPTSMPGDKVRMMSKAWTKLFERHIGANEANLTSIPESVAPYAYYKRDYGEAANVLTIDIGGGTSDAYIVDANGHGLFITSFRFAANSLLGDGFIANGIGTNGFVKRYRQTFNDILESNHLSNLREILDKVYAGGSSDDFISMLFSLKGNSEVKAAKCADKLDFNAMLQNSAEAKTLVMIFYTAIIYHLARFIKAKQAQGFNIQEPSVVAFSGNGSRLLQVIGAGDSIGNEILANYTKAIFEKVNGRKFPHGDFKVITDPQKPKESTSKGGLLVENAPSQPELEEMTDSLLGTGPDNFLDGRKYSQLTDEDWNGLSESIDEFTSIFYELLAEKKLQANFGILPTTELEKVRHIFTDDVRNRTANALISFNLMASDQEIEDTLFFYPITAALNTLAQKLLK